MGETKQTLSQHWSFSSPGYDTLLPPGPLAEHVDPLAALAGMRHCMTLRKPEGHFLSAWHHVEYALNQSETCLDDTMRRKYMGDAAWLLSEIIARSSNANLYAQAITLNIFLPVLTKRAIGQAVTPADCSDIYFSFGAAFDSIDKFQIGDSSFKASRYSEMIGPALSSRSRQPNALLYPASPREESSPSQPYNHDGYFIKDDAKIPLQTKLIPTDKPYEDPTKVIYIEPIAQNALERAGIIEDDCLLNIGEATLIIATLIREESQGGTDYAGKTALDYLTRSIMARYMY